MCVSHSLFSCCWFMYYDIETHWNQNFCIFLQKVKMLMERRRRPTIHGLIMCLLADCVPFRRLRKERCRNISRDRTTPTTPRDTLWANRRLKGQGRLRYSTRRKSRVSFSKLSSFVSIWNNRRLRYGSAVLFGSENPVVEKQMRCKSNVKKITFESFIIVTWYFTICNYLPSQIDKLI